MFAEQAHNAQLALRSRIGTVVNKFTVDEEVLYRTLSDVRRKIFEGQTTPGWDTRVNDEQLAFVFSKITNIKVVLH